MQPRVPLLALAANLPGGSAVAAPFLVPTNVPGIMAYPAPPADFDAFHASNRALAAYGLPPRPPPGGNGRLRRLWEMLIRAAPTRIQPVLRPLPGTGGPFLAASRPASLQTGASTTYSQDWSGVALGMAILFNMTTNESVAVSMAAPTGTFFWGNSAEWIVGRSIYNGSMAPLMNYASIWMSSENAVQMGVSGSGSFGAPPFGTTPLMITMTDSKNQTISTATQLGATGTVFQNSGSARQFPN